MTLSPTALEAAAKAAMLVRARLPGSQEEWPVLSLDPDFDDLPANGDEGCDDDEITQEAVLRVCAAAITAYLTRVEKDGWVVVPTEPTAAMIEAGCDNNPTQWNEGTDLGFAADVANDVYRAMLAAAQNGGERPAPPMGK